MLSLRSSQTCVARRVSSRTPCVVRPRATVRSTPKDVDAQLEKALKEAKDCDITNKNCASEWDAVEELAAAKSHLKDAAKADPYLNDPLEVYCKEAPDADECRVYED